jgi:hypothetical protein
MRKNCTKNFIWINTVAKSFSLQVDTEKNRAIIIQRGKNGI